MDKTPFSFKRSNYGSVNSGTNNELPVGKHNYQVTNVSYEQVKADKSGKRHHVKVDLRHSSGSNYVQFFEIAPKDKNDETRARIAGDVFGSITDACGIATDNIKTAHFKKMKGKDIGIRTAESVSGKGKTSRKYINIREVIAEGWDEAEDIEDEEDDDEEDEVPTPKPKKSKSRKKPEPEEEEDDEDDDDDSPF